MDYLSLDYLPFMRRLKCFWCESKNWGYWGVNERYWAVVRCRSCQSDWYWHPVHGSNSLNGMIAIYQRTCESPGQ